MRYRLATLDDIPLLAQMNDQLRQDEQSRYQLDMPQLEERMRRLIQDEGYTAVLFMEEANIIAYALYYAVEGGIHLRQFFVSRSYRRQGVGRQAIDLLRREIWPRDARITLEVLTHNERAYQFWKALGFTEYAITLELVNT
ncbi:MAG: GNAT family N-acetyltransferase [Anaerolineae bacterium]|nr:GNAT family N-acetyltransferase [Anaerolineae bacterium]